MDMRSPLAHLYDIVNSVGLETDHKISLDFPTEQFKNQNHALYRKFASRPGSRAPRNWTRDDEFVADALSDDGGWSPRFLVTGVDPNSECEWDYAKQCFTQVLIVRNLKGLRGSNSLNMSADIIVLDVSPASVVACIAHYLGEYLRDCNQTTIFPCFFGSFQCSPTSMICMTETLGPSMRATWLNEITHDAQDDDDNDNDNDDTGATKNEPLTATRVMADLCQITFNLAYLQRHMGLCIGACTIDNFFAYRLGHETTIPASPSAHGPLLPLSWNGVQLDVPTYGVLWRCADWTHASFVANGIRVDSQPGTPDDMNHVDLRTLAQSCMPVVQQRISAADPLKATLVGMLRAWANRQNRHPDIMAQLNVQYECVQGDCVSRAKNTSLIFKAMHETVRWKGSIPDLQLPFFEIFSVKQHQSDLPILVHDQ